MMAMIGVSSAHLASGKVASSPEREKLTSRTAAEAFVGGVCFKLGPPRLIGAELEWLTDRGDGECSRIDLPTLASVLGPHTPKSIEASSPALPLPARSTITIEPGGQIELSSAPYPSAERLIRSLKDDEDRLRQLLSVRSIRMTSAAADTRRPPHRLLQLPRYCAMEKSFNSVGPFGKLMMCNTAAVQISVDAGADTAEVAARWQALHAIGPALLAAFATSPTMYGAPQGNWASQRMRTWLELDPARAYPPGGDPTDPIGSYARWALDVPLLCVRREGDVSWSAPPGATFADWLEGALDDVIERRPDEHDLAYHLTTLFPPVRAAGHLEVRYLDAQPGDQWVVPINALEALMSRSDVVAEATAVARDTAGRWCEAAEYGLADSELRNAATDLLQLAAAASPSSDGAGVLDAAADRCRRGQIPTESDA